MKTYVIAFIIVGVILTLVIELFIRKKYGVGFVRYRPVNRTHKWLEVLIFVLFIISVPIGAFIYSYHGAFLWLFGYFTILGFIRAFMECKKGIKEDKENMIYSFWGVCNFVIFIGLLLFLF